MTRADEEMAKWVRAANEIVAYGLAKGVDLGPCLATTDFWFRKGVKCRVIGFKKTPEGVKYGFRGSFDVPPTYIKSFDPSIYVGRWGEGGYVEGIGDAFELVKAMLVDWKELDELPVRNITSWGV